MVLSMMTGNSALAAGSADSVSLGTVVTTSTASRSAGVTSPTASALRVADLPAGAAPLALEFAHFPSRTHAFVWRNWELVSAERMALVIGARPEEIIRTGHAMGLKGNPGMPTALQRRAAITIIRRNWHLLPYDQLLTLLGWTAEEMAFALREDDFLFVKLGNLKPRCLPLRHETPTESVLEREREIARCVEELFPVEAGSRTEPLFSFVEQLSSETSATAAKGTTPHSSPTTAPRICYSYFALYGDPLLDDAADPYPDGLLARLAEVGVNGVWLQGILSRLAPFPWDIDVSKNWQSRMERLRRLTVRARRHGIGIYLYLNEPRSMPLSFHEAHSGMKGVTEGDYAALCTGAAEVQQWITASVESICREAPDLAGFFTISGSENLTNCWSHGRGGACSRCAGPGGASVIADLHRRMLQGIHRAGSSARLIAWDWGWQDGWAEAIAAKVPKEITLMSVSEWDVPITRGGISTTVGEYSMSVLGPGPRARRHWNAARSNGLPVMAKIQAGNTWELSAVPYIPVAATVARHCAALRGAGVEGLLLGWTLGGFPSPNLEVATLVSNSTLTAGDAMEIVAQRRFGPRFAPAVGQAWNDFSTAFSEFPFHTGVVYNGPLQMGPANLLWSKPTGYSATMVGFPYDDLNAWRSVYPEQAYMNQLLKVADGFDNACRDLRKALADATNSGNAEHRIAAEQELSIGEAAAIHFRSAANQAKFIAARTRLVDSSTPTTRTEDKRQMRELLLSELDLARRLKRLQEQDSRIGFEASNQYFYTPQDLAEKALNCHYLLDSMDRAN